MDPMGNEIIPKITHVQWVVSKPLLKKWRFMKLGFRQEFMDLSMNKQDYDGDIARWKL